MSCAVVDEPRRRRQGIATALFAGEWIRGGRVYHSRAAAVASHDLKNASRSGLIVPGLVDSIPCGNPS